MLLLSRCTCTTGLLGPQILCFCKPSSSSASSVQRLPLLPGNCSFPSYGGTMLWRKSNRSHFPAAPQKRVPGCVGTSLWARSAPHARVQGSWSYTSIYLSCTHCQSNCHCRALHIFAGCLFTALRTGALSVTATYLPQLLASDTERQPLCPSSRQSAAQL